MVTSYCPHCDVFHTDFEFNTKKIGCNNGKLFYTSICDECEYGRYLVRVHLTFQKLIFTKSKIASIPFMPANLGFVKP